MFANLKLSTAFVEKAALTLAFIFALAWSAPHIGRLFGENGWLAVASMYALLTVTVLRAPRRELLIGVVATLSALVSVFASADYALSAALGGPVMWREVMQMDEWQWASVVAYGSPPLLPYAVFLIARSFAPPAPEPAPVGTQLATTKPTDLAVANPPTDRKPTVTVAKSEPVANPQQPLLPTEEVGNLATWQLANPPILEGQPLPHTDLSDELMRAVVVYQREGSYGKAAKRIGGISDEGVRKQVIAALQQDPAWVEAILPPEKLPKVQ